MLDRRQFAPSIAVFIVLCHILVLWQMGTSAGGVLWSNLVQLATGIAAAGAYSYAAHRTPQAFVRRFCLLASSSFLLWSIAQTGWLFYEYRLHQVVPTISPINILFFFFVAPLGIAIFLPVREKQPEDSITFFLDSIQLAAVLLTAYLYFFYTPAFWLGRQGELNQAIRHASEWRNWLLTGGLVLRALLEERATIRSLFARMAVVMGIYGAGEGLFFNLTPASVINTGRWFDLTWSISFAVAFVFAFRTRPAELPEATGRSEGVRPNLAFNLMPALIPLLVLITAARMVRDQLVIAASAVLLSFGCYSLRVFITQLQAQRAAGARRRSEEFFRKLAAASGGMGAQLFESLVMHVAEFLGTSYTYVGVLGATTEPTITTLAAIKDGHFVPSFEYKVRNAPCEHVLGKQLHFHAKNVGQAFPLHHLVFEMTSYMGAPLISSSGDVLGVFAVADRRRLRNQELARSVLQICATRAAAEIERIQIEEARRTSEEVFSLAFHQSSDIMMLMKPYPKQARARLMDINEAGLAFWGGARDEVIGKTGQEVEAATGVEFWAYEADRAMFYKELFEHGKLADREIEVRKRSGAKRKLILNAGVFHLKGAPWVFMSGRDVTEERVAQEALAASEAKFRDLFENANDIIFTANCEGGLLSLNKVGRRVCSVASEDVSKRNIREVLDPASHEAYATSIRDLLRTREIVTCEVALLGGKHRKCLLELSLRPVMNDEVVIAIQGTGRDITERRDLENKLLQAQKMEVVGTLAGGIAHDFNNLLTVIAGYTHLAKDRVAAGRDASADLEEVREAVQRASALTSQMLAFSRKHVANLAPMNLNDCVTRMEKMLRRVMREDVRLELKLDPEIAPILADTAQIDQVIMNLAVNARDAMPDGGELRFVTSSLRLHTPNPRLGLKAGDYVVLTVRDTGIGMSQETLTHIFEPFFTTKEAGKGTGLGLSTVYGIVHQTGGRIDVASETGQGTSFTAYFPAVERAELPAVQSHGDTVSQGKETLLLLEDDTRLRTLAQRTLESAGYTVYAASGVEHATRIIQEITREIDLAITDVVMAEGGGAEFVRRLRDSRPKTKVLFISGYTDGRLPAEYIQSGAGFLAKPFEPAQLATKIRQILDSPQPAAAPATAR